MDKLKKCPFCGKTNIDRTGDGQMQWWECVNCGATSGNSPGDEYCDESLWNRRADDWINTAFPPKKDCLILLWGSGEDGVEPYQYKVGDNIYELADMWKLIALPETD